MIIVLFPGISILFSKAEKEIPKLFAFMSPLSTEVWMYMATAYLIVSLMLFFQARYVQKFYLELICTVTGVII